ncbi:MAG TPA: anthranilate phosphoribosyltransferase, partial [Porticoccaceae bacterium]
VLQRLGSEHVLVVHSRDGLDEFSLASATQVAELRAGEIREYELVPEDLGVKSQSLVGLSVDGPGASLALIRDALGKRATEAGSKAAEMIALNAGAAIYVSGIASDHAQGVAMAQDIIASGQAMEKLTELAMFTDCLGDLE